MKQTEIISEWQDALDMEIIQMKKKQNSGIRVENGRCIKKEEGSYVYWFTLPYSRSFPEGGSIQIDYQNKNLQGIVISSEETECIIELDQYLGDILGYARLIYEPWELLEKLWQRLEDIKERQGKSSRAIRTIQPSGVTHHPPGKHLLHEAYVRSKYNDLTYIWGPPGTGKTYTLARVAAYHYTEGQRILILSHSNAAVDVLIEEMHHFLTENDRWTPGEVVRYGQNRKSLSAEARDVSLTQLLELQDPKLSEERGKVEKYRMKLKKKLTKKFSNYDSERLSRLEMHYQKIKEKLKRREGTALEEASVVGTTLSKAAIDSLIYDNEYDLVIVDEASMAYIPQLAFAATLGKRVIICGDFKQLPPISSSFHPLVKKWLNEDIFHRSGVAKVIEAGGHHPQLLLLPEQRRMHPSISSFTNRYIYHSRVYDHPSVAEARASIVMKRPFKGDGGILFDVPQVSQWGLTHKGSRWNPISGILSISLAVEALQDGVTSLGIVTPYRVQAQWIKTLLDEGISRDWEGPALQLYASTVHGFQGSENDMMIFDVVDGPNHERPGRLLTGKSSDRLVNVAVTRARGKFILMGDHRFMKRKGGKSMPLRQLIDHLESTGRNITFQEVEPVATKRIKWFPWGDQKKFLKDLASSKNSIRVLTSNRQDIPPDIMALLQAASRTVEVTFEDHAGGTSLIIDQKVLWINPFEQGSFPFHLRLFSKTICSRYMELFKE